MLLTCSTFFTVANAEPLATPETTQTKQKKVAKTSNSNNFSKPKKVVWEMGLEIEADSGSCTGILASFPVPIDWDEQTVTLLSEKKSPSIKRVFYRELDKTVKLMVVSIPQLRSGDIATVNLKFEIQKRNIEGPTEKKNLKLAPKKNVVRKYSKYLRPSPYIESKDRLIVEIAEKIGNDKENDWENVKEIYEWVRENIEYKFDTKIKSCLKAIQDGQGDCEEMSSLFVALCRAKGIPARAVWIPGHTYPEFYLEDEKGNGYWYPCQPAGNYEFGAMTELKPILQKGDNFKLPGHRKPQRYATPTMTVKNAKGQPKIKWICKQVEAQSDR